MRKRGAATDDARRRAAEARAFAKRELEVLRLTMMELMGDPACRLRTYEAYHKAIIATVPPFTEAQVRERVLAEIAMAAAMGAHTFFPTDEMRAGATRSGIEEMAKSGRAPGLTVAKLQDATLCAAIEACARSGAGRPRKGASAGSRELAVHAVLVELGIAIGDERATRQLLTRSGAIARARAAIVGPIIGTD